MICKSVLHLAALFSAHRLQRRNAAALYDIETQTSSDKFQVLDDIASPEDPLRNDAREGLSEKLGAMEEEAKAFAAALRSDEARAAFMKFLQR